MLFSKLTEALPSWEVYHTGGNIYNANQDFKTLDGKEITVLIHDMGANIYHYENNKNEFVNTESFMDNYELHDNWIELIHYDEDTIEVESFAYDIFPKDIIAFISRSIQTFDEIVWG